MIAVKRLLRHMAIYAFHLLFVKPMLRWFVGVRYRRRSLVPTGPCLVVANHNSHLDAAVLLSLFPLSRLPHVHPVAAADYFGKTWLRSTMAMLFMNAIAIERTPKAGQDTLAPMVEALEAGESLIFFPEGSRGEAGVVGPFRSGVGRLARQLPGLLVVPVFLSGPERIWPRGQKIPVPLGIDVNVGKPRTYPDEPEPREIADRVREDVLALAPPPPPVPGPRPTPPVRVAVCGIDAGTRNALFLDLVRRLGRIDRTMGIGTPVVQADASGVTETAGRVHGARSRGWLAVLAWAFRTGGLFQGYKFAEMVARARLDEGLEDGRRARFVVGDGSALVDLMAWAEADFYSGVFDDKGLQRVMLYLSGERRIPTRQWWRFVRKATEVWLLNVFDLARLRSPDLLVLVVVPSSFAMQRIGETGRALQPFENEKFLAKLQEAYRIVVGLLKRRGVEVIEIDGTTLDLERDGEFVENACARVAVEAGGVLSGGRTP